MSYQAMAAKVSVFNPANAISVFRLFFIIPFWWCVKNNHPLLGFTMLVMAAVLDKVDGIIARRFGYETVLGSILDAIVDAILAALYCIISVHYLNVSPWIAYGIIGLGIVNAAFRGLYMLRCKKSVNYRSFAMEYLVGYLAIPVIGDAVLGYTTTALHYTVALVLIGLVIIYDAKRMLIDPVPV